MALLLLGLTQLRNYKMYKLTTNHYGGECQTVIRLKDNASIPFDPDNTDYQAYLAWIEEGNTPEAAE